MIINRQNYQVWVTDYYDGRLDNFQVEVLKEFMSKNPDLMSEFEDYPELFLHEEGEDSFDKGSLFKTPEQLTNEQVEHYSIALMEGDLEEDQKQEILELQKTDPRFRENINVYGRIKLRPVEAEYPAKSGLIKIPARRRTLRIITNSLSVAASVAILFSLFFIFTRNERTYMADQIIASGEQAIEETESSRDRVSAIDISEGLPAYIVARTDITVSDPVPVNNIILPEHQPDHRKEIISISPLTAKAEIEINPMKHHYLLAEANTYSISPLIMDSINTSLSVREFIAFHFRKEILNDEDPDIEKLKAWEIADAGIKGFNKILGWNMQLETEKNNEGKLENVSFTSELIKFDHRPKKNNTGL